MKDYILETCVDSVESAMAAAEGGADRLELCSNLIIGGTTPGPWLFEEIRKRSDIRIHALIRPRFGDFCYTDAEFSMIRNAVKDFRKMGAEGVVVGILKPDGTLNMEQMKELMDAAGDMSVTLHRAFDVCADRGYGTGDLAGNRYYPYLRTEEYLPSGRGASEGTGNQEPGAYYHPGGEWRRCGSDPPALSPYRDQGLSYERQGCNGQCDAVSQGRCQYGTSDIQ